MRVLDFNKLPGLILRIEGAVVFFSALFIYHIFSGSWILFVLLLLIPDVSIIGFLFNKRVGSIIYNLAHNYILSGLLIFTGYLTSNFVIFEIGIIFTAHVGMDRMLGFGLKYPTDFKDTHLQKV